MKGNGTSATWSGTMATSGTVSVMVTNNGQTARAAADVNVSDRLNWALSPKPSVRQTNNPQNPYICMAGTTSAQPLYVDTTPVLNDLVGHSCAVVYLRPTPATIDGGPNDGYSYLTSISDAGEYSWVISNDIDNPQSTFYKAQCGNYNFLSNSGFISGANLDADDQRHEGGLINSHYAEYSFAYSSSAYNPGSVMQSFVEHVDGNQLNVDIANEEHDIGSAIIEAAHPEPCNEKYVGYDSACTYQGPMNFDNVPCQ